MKNKETYKSPRITGHTKEYERFVNIIGNRNVNQSHVLKIMESMQRIGNKSAIICRLAERDGKEVFEIIDGQHRFEALKLCDLPVEYDVWDIDNRGMIALNENQKTWTLEDYLNFGVNDKIPDYVALKEYREKTGIAIGVLLQVFSSPDDFDSTDNVGRVSCSALFKKLIWKMNQREEGEKVIERLKDFYNLFNIGHWSLQRFVCAFIQVNKNPQYDHDKMLRQLEQCSNLMRKQSSVRDFVKNIETVYNYNLTAKNRVIFLQSKDMK